MKKRFLKYGFWVLSLFFVMLVVSGNNLIEKTGSNLSITSLEAAVTVMLTEADQSFETEKTIYQSTFPDKQFFEYACYVSDGTILNPVAELTCSRVVEKLQV